MNVRITSDLKKLRIANSKDIAEIMQRILKRENKLGQRKEHFWLVGLNVEHEILFIELSALGNQNACAIRPQDLFRVAVVKDADKLIIVHNHPKGKLTPSTADLGTTMVIAQKADVIGIPVIDHLIINQKDYYSFADNKQVFIENIEKELENEKLLKNYYKLKK